MFMLVFTTIKPVMSLLIQWKYRIQNTDNPASSGNCLFCLQCGVLTVSVFTILLFSLSPV